MDLTKKRLKIEVVIQGWQLEALINGKIKGSYTPQEFYLCLEDIEEKKEEKNDSR